MSLEIKVIKSRLGLLFFAEELGNISRTCKYLGCCRETFYRYKDLFAEGGEQAFKEMNRRGPNVKNCIEAHIEKLVVTFVIENLAFCQTRTSNELKKEGLFISPCSVRCVWLRHELETFQKRLKALKAKVAQEEVILIEFQVIALYRKSKKRNSLMAILRHISWAFLVHRTLIMLVISKV